MVMNILYLLMALAIIIAWFGMRRTAIGVFGVSLILGIYWFAHLLTYKLTIQL